MFFLPLKQNNKKKIVSKYLLSTIVAIAALFFYGSHYYRLSPGDFLKIGLRIATVKILSIVYQDDLTTVNRLRDQYWVGSSMRNVSFPATGNLQPSSIPFIYEELNEDYLDSLRTEFDLEGIIASAESEYEAMLQLGAWLGTRWDHGTSRLEGTKEERNPLDIIRAGEAGEKYWCEIATIVTVQTATALGWPARHVSLSKNGYELQHGVAEVWSNQFNKWFVLDTDFNVVFESQGVPLSAYELCHSGPDLKRRGLLELKRFAADKPSLKYQDLIPFYAYVQVDLRNDWLSRSLRRGSPAGGDLATWWTSRKDLGPVLTASKEIERQELFDWKVNQVWDRIEKDVESGRVKINFYGYSPYFKSFQVRLDDGPWIEVQGNSHEFVIRTPENHRVDTRMITMSDYEGPVSSKTFSLRSVD